MSPVDIEDNSLDTHYKALGRQVPGVFQKSKVAIRVEQSKGER